MAALQLVAMICPHGSSDSVDCARTRANSVKARRAGSSQAEFPSPTLSYASTVVLRFHANRCSFASSAESFGDGAVESAFLVHQVTARKTKHPAVNSHIHGDDTNLGNFMPSVSKKAAKLSTNFIGVALTFSASANLWQQSESAFQFCDCALCYDRLNVWDASEKFGA